MADQGKWFKLWCSSLDDQDLENLTIHQWFGWARFGAYVKRHGKAGKIRLREPATAIMNILRVGSLNDALEMIKMFPNYTIEEIKNTHQNVTGQDRYTYSVKCRNWNKYQGDFSGERVKKYRKTVTANVTAQEEKRSRREEKRREETVLAPGGDPYHLPDPKTEPKKCLVLSYKSRKGVAFDNRDWDKGNFARAMVSAGTLLALCKDLNSAEACIDDLSREYEEKQLNWTLETISRNAADWLKKNGRSDANSSRAGLRMAIAQRRAEIKDQNGVAQVPARPEPVSVRDGADTQDRDKANGERCTRTSHGRDVD